MNANMPLVSIIFPVYNVEPYIIQSFESIINQDYKNLEIIIIDDCGIDNSIDIIQSIINNNKDLKINIIHHENNKGLSAARNTGLKEATGDYIFFLDSDDYIDSNCISKLVSYTITNQLDVCLGYTKTIGGNELSNQHKQPFIQIGSHSIIKRYIHNNISCTAWNKLVSREIIINNNILFTKDIIYEDGLWLLQVLLKSKKIGGIIDTTYYYLKRAGSITTASTIKRQLDSRITIINELIKLFYQTDDSALKELLLIYINKERLKLIIRLGIHSDIYPKSKIIYHRVKNIDKNLTSNDRYGLLLKIPFKIFQIIGKHYKHIIKDLRK